MDVALVGGSKLFCIAAVAIKPAHFPSSLLPLTFHSSLTQTIAKAVAFVNALHLYFKPIAVITMECQLMMAELRRIMQEDVLSQKYSITPCNATAPCFVLPPYLHTAPHLQEFNPHIEG